MKTAFEKIKAGLDEALAHAEGWRPLTPAIMEAWKKHGNTIQFRDARGQMGFGTYDLAKAMKLKPTEWKDE
jgi:hypothetical protein